MQCEGSDRPRPIWRSLGFAFFLLLALSSTSAGVFIADLFSDSAAGMAPSVQTLPVAELSTEAYGPLAAAPDFVVIEGKIEKGSSLGASLAAQGVAADAVHTISTAMRPLFDLRRARAGQEYRLIQHKNGSVVDFRYEVSALKSVHLFQDGEHIVAEEEEPELVRRTSRVAGVVSSSVYAALRNLGESPELGYGFTDVFAWDVDFARLAQPGDQFNILYQRIYRIDESGQEVYVGPGQILAATYEGASGRHSAVYYEVNGQGGYYRLDGTSVRRQFLSAPLRYSRISSNYTNARHHPILKVTRPHHGIDYAAPEGTPIWAVADGTVVFKGWSNGYGQLVKVRHVNGYISYYAHMSRFASGLQVGQRVEQKEVIGYVGSTGLATGPHICFRIQKDGHYVNPSSLKTSAGEPVPAKSMTEFKAHRDALLAELKADSLQGEQLATQGASPVVETF